MIFPDVELDVIAQSVTLASCASRFGEVERVVGDSSVTNVSAAKVGTIYRTLSWVNELSAEVEVYTNSPKLSQSATSICSVSAQNLPVTIDTDFVGPVVSPDA